MRWIALYIGLTVVAWGNAKVEKDVPSPYKTMKNPLKPKLEVLSSARKLFDESCVFCHGDGGKGDGERGKDSKHAPADFSSRRIANFSDQRLMWRISEGLPKKGMYGYKQQYSEKERWSLVLLVRSFGSKRAK